METVLLGFVRLNSVKLPSFTGFLSNFIWLVMVELSLDRGSTGF